MTAQSQAETFIKEAQAYLAQGDYKQAQLSLQDAINDINNVLAQQISQSFPAEINGLKANEDNGNSTNTAIMGAMGGGMTISKIYQHLTKKKIPRRSIS
ncbi:MAG: hypothetical protein IPP15_21165 [Saprospiraceae bacterium]|uniref:Uncharacterized protein n=1 Tax=Candidatus Opimibacter skivensis TaxID=2982028 RepID=A0A9D7SX33_9BACT|nr:hypothetical protein [Candidatus Opimibacter skivensis]